jgi:hypothetical protein
MPEIQHHDYETVHAVCDHCGSLCIFNRMADIGEPGPYGGRSVECFECGEKFWIWGDIINPAYELFIFAADEHFKAKRYMLYVGTLAQAWEIFLGTFAYSNYLYRSYFNERPHLDVERFNQLSSQFSNAIQKFTFDPLRNLLINTVIKRVHPQTLDESESAIPRIVAEKFGDRPRKAYVSAFPDAHLRDILLQLQQLETGELRNRIFHKDAYRPKREEVETLFAMFVVGCAGGEQKTSGANPDQSREPTELPIAGRGKIPPCSSTGIDCGGEDTDNVAGAMKAQPDPASASANASASTHASTNASTSASASASASNLASNSPLAMSSGDQRYVRLTTCRLDTYAQEQGMNLSERMQFADELADRLYADNEADSQQAFLDELDAMGVPRYPACEAYAKHGDE